MFSLTIKSTEVATKSGVSRQGKPYSIIEQQGVIELPNGERRVIPLALEANEAPLTPGMYEPKGSAAFVGQYGKLEVSTRARHWQPAKAAAVKAA